MNWKQTLRSLLPLGAALAWLAATPAAGAARAVAAGDADTEWFRRHGSTPITEVPDHWPEAYRAVVERRIACIAAKNAAVSAGSTRYSIVTSTGPRSSYRSALTTGCGQWPEGVTLTCAASCLRRSRRASPTPALATPPARR